MDQSRALRDAAAKSNVWSFEIHLTEDTVFYDAFFWKAVLLARNFCVTRFYIDDTSRTNTFGLTIVSVLCSDDSDTLHTVAL